MDVRLSRLAFENCAAFAGTLRSGVDLYHCTNYISKRLGESTAGSRTLFTTSFGRMTAVVVGCRSGKSHESKQSVHIFINQQAFL